MGRNSLDLHKKLVKYQQQIKISRRGFQIKCNNINNKNKPDFALGAFQVKGNVSYTLVINVDIPPNKSNGLIIDFWGLSANSHLELLNRHNITTVNRDLRIKFWTYPKTRFFFMTFRIQSEDDIDINQSITYSINYIYIDSKDPLPKNSVTPTIPIKLDLNYDLECNPRTLEELDLNDPLKIFDKIPINLDIFEHSLLNYLLQKETSPHFLESLKQNIANCNIPSEKHSLYQYNEISSRELTELNELKNNIIKKSREMEEYLSKIDNLTHHKNSLENTLDIVEKDTTPFNSEKHENYINILRKFQDGLNTKLNTLKQLKTINKNQLGKLEKKDIDNVDEIIDYYENRINKDKIIFNEILTGGLNEWNNYKEEVVQPQNKQQNTQQNKLDKILSHYRTYQNKSLSIKKELDNNIIKFMIMWYQFILTKNYPSNKSY